MKKVLLGILSMSLVIAIYFGIIGPSIIMYSKGDTFIASIFDILGVDLNANKTIKFTIITNQDETNANNTNSNTSENTENQNLIIN